MSQLSKSEIYTRKAVINFLKNILEHFNEYKMQAKYLPFIYSIYLLLSANKSKVNGFLNFTIYNNEDEILIRYLSISIDETGLKLITGSNFRGKGGETYSDDIFPLENENLFSEDKIESFIEDFDKDLKLSTKQIQIFQGGSWAKDLLS